MTTTGNVNVWKKNAEKRRINKKDNSWKKDVSVSNAILTDKFVKKWMRQARQIALDNDTPCSRKVGCIIVDRDNIVRGMGYNGAPRNTPHCDSKEYIDNILLPKLTNEEKDKLVKIWYNDGWGWDKEEQYENISRKLDGCNKCPRRLLNVPSGQRTELCSCQHGERNAISNSNGPVNGCILLGYCCISCFQCTGAVINARIAECHFLEGPEYESGCLKLYEYAGIPVFLHREDEIWTN